MDDDDQPRYWHRTGSEIGSSGHPMTLNADKNCRAAYAQD
jgi:hypothetical protein